MKKVVGASIAFLLLASPITPASAAALPVAPVVTTGTSAGLGAWVAGGIVGVATFLGIYDFIRRTTCSGDFLGPGGPGFSEPMPATGNILPPQCKVAANYGRRHRH